MGKSRDITSYVRGQVNILRSEGYSQRQIGSQLKISKWAVQNALRLGNSTGRQNCGRKRKTTPDNDNNLRLTVLALILQPRFLAS